MNAQVGTLVISSVYDFDGVDTAKPNIATQANPSQTAFYSRPARFVRIEKAVEIPPKTVRKINQSAFGPAGMGMREILGYAPVQPDGSVQIQVPANVPFTIDVLDANARRITAQHTSWLQVTPGETKTCNGCHTAGNKTTPSHGRTGLTVAVNKGAPTTGEPFPSTNSALFANAGETMAQTLARISCESGSALGALLADPRDRRDLHQCLDQRRDAAGRRNRRELLLHLWRHRRGAHQRNSERAADERQLRAVDRAMPHHHPLRQCELEPDAALHSESVEQRDTRRDRRRRAEHVDDVHQLSQHARALRTRSRCPRVSST